MEDKRQIPKSLNRVGVFSKTIKNGRIIKKTPV